MWTDLARSVRAGCRAHGLAALLIDGPLRGLNPTQADDAARHVIDMIERGI
ncbi:hypothetical protein SNOUR_36590 [Streptomyces noursei ATCC 11455]|nr:hypothetical protein SNOUR_36590 [Streptomyces noursei ATCC 11455]